MRYRYYVVYNYFKNDSNGVGCMIHERGDKLTDIKKIISLSEAILKSAKLEGPGINKVIVTNFILIDEFEEVS